jgi:hypothetical protein
VDASLCVDSIKLLHCDIGGGGMNSNIATVITLISALVSVVSVVVTVFFYKSSRSALNELQALSAKGRELPPTPDVQDPEAKAAPDNDEPDQDE